MKVDTFKKAYLFIKLKKLKIRSNQVTKEVSESDKESYKILN